jgi:hypothetical protein
MNVTFVDFSRIFLLGIFIFKWLTARRLYKSFGVKGLTPSQELCHTACGLSLSSLHKAFKLARGQLHVVFVTSVSDGRLVSSSTLFIHRQFSNHKCSIFIHLSSELVQ